MDQLDVTCFIISLFNAQHVSDINTSIRVAGFSLQAEACYTDTTPTSHTETPTHIETRTNNQCGDTIEKSKAPGDGCINVRNMLSIEEVK